MLIGQKLVDAMTSDVSYTNHVQRRSPGRRSCAASPRCATWAGRCRACGVRSRRAFPGPRIFPSGAMISQTGGHGDFRLPHGCRAPPARVSVIPDLPAPPPFAGGADECCGAPTEQLMLGATQIKLMAGGGVTSIYDPIDATQYTLDGSAPQWLRRELGHLRHGARLHQPCGSGRHRAGVKAVEHGQLVDEETVRLMAQKGIWWSLQPFLDNELANPQAGANRVKQLMVAAGTIAPTRWRASTR